MLVVEGFLAFCGLYMLFLLFKMKEEGVIPSFFLNPKIKIERANDIPGFIAYLFPRGVAFAIVMTLFATLELIGSFVGVLNWILVVARVLFIVAVVFYCKVTITAQNRFLFNQGGKNDK